ncbi:MAG: potassium channel family protein [Solirubrobacteraceae bacterium]
MSTAGQTAGREDPSERPPEYRYGAVLLLTLLSLVFVIVAPSADWSRAVALLIESAALLVAVGTARAPRAVRRRRTEVGGLLAIVVVFAVTLSAVRELDFLLSGLIAGAIPVAIVGGLLSLVRERGVTLQAVAGALAIYLTVGLMFAWLIGFVARLGSTPYFAQGIDGTESDRVYYSFTVLTTTGFGDFTAATHLGRALAVIEMLVGQIYLVTVIGVLVGNFVGRQRS